MVKHFVFSVDSAQGFRFINYISNLESLMQRNPDTVHKKFLQIFSCGNLVFYRKVSMFVLYTKGKDYCQIIVFRLVPDEDSFRVQIIKQFSFNRCLYFNPLSIDSDLTTVTLSNKIYIELNGIKFHIMKLVSVDLRNIESLGFKLKEDLIFLPLSFWNYFRVTFDDTRRIYLDNIEKKYIFEIPKYHLNRAKDLGIPRLLLGLESAFSDFLSLTVDLQNKETPIELWEFEIKKTEEDSVEVLENKIG